MCDSDKKKIYMCDSDKNKIYMCDSDKNKQQKIYSFIYEEQKLQQHSETLITYDRVIERDLSRGGNHCHIYYRERSIKRGQSLSHLL